MWLYPLLLLASIHVAAAINCLVVRPGRGLVSEPCPDRAVGCRIKIHDHSIQWYEFSALYDRNQLVCVNAGEYKEQSGCVRKPSGSYRCWCGEGDDCNSAEKSKELYHRFMKHNPKKHNHHHHHKIEPKKHTTTSTSTTTTSTTTTTTTSTTTPSTTTEATTSVRTPEQREKEKEEKEEKEEENALDEDEEEYYDEKEIEELTKPQNPVINNNIRIGQIEKPKKKEKTLSPYEQEYERLASERIRMEQERRIREEEEAEERRLKLILEDEERENALDEAEDPPEQQKKKEHRPTKTIREESHIDAIVPSPQSVSEVESLLAEARRAKERSREQRLREEEELERVSRARAEATRPPLELEEDAEMLEYDDGLGTFGLSIREPRSQAAATAVSIATAIALLVL